MAIDCPFLDHIGNTPLIRLRAASERTGCEIFGKAEFMNPGGSVKDRAAKYLLLDALARGVIAPGGTVIEGSAGNTGIGLTLAGNALGLHTIILMPDTQSAEKQSALRGMGAELRTVPAAPYSNPDNYVHQARRLAESMAVTAVGGVFYANQWDNLANRNGHTASTGPEIWAQTGGRLDGFICAVGTGGTLAGVSDYLKQRRPGLVTAAADPDGAAICSWVKNGVLASQGSSITEGIGQNRITGNLESARIDDAFTIPDSEWLPVLWELIASEGLYVGTSSGINVAGAIRLAQQLGPGHRIATILCDSASRYESKLFNPAFLHGKGLQPPPWLHPH
ncbi:MAG: cysteine synthase A [Lysobacterales bacterium CG17_big_fil_post_rev_8_21_14_2_50_64_11]|nr:MAG: cysteine synthase A [Xanthomonadales bacterium CG17_big_fil_post_rev_8_21_14_2_50_64_11]PIX59732.1 MAG: cysteine synthase A [Xanthomonadales bacterium CG_4_10_14_3_um_filter_64_11]